MILKCDCKSTRGLHAGRAGAEYQDHKYGHGKRVHNPTKGHTWRCTICNTERSSK